MGISCTARPPLLGGDWEKGKACFEKALQSSQGKFFAAGYYCARYYAVGVQDRELFMRLLVDIIQGNPHELEDACLVNRIVQERAKELVQKADDYFL
jgi:hypothetical protein